MFNYLIDSPDNINSVADWAEFYLCFTNESISKSELSAAVEKSRAGEVDDDFIDSVWRQMTFRQSLYGNTISPFKAKSRIIEPRLKSWVDIPEYMACLIFALEGNPNTSAGTSASAGKLFERLSNEAVRNYIGGKSIIYGFPAEQTIEDLAKRFLGERFNYNPPSYRKDRNLDLFAWKPFEDNRPSQMILIIQCASGHDWPGKIKELNVDAWKKYIHFAAQPIKGFTVPVVIDNERFEEHSTDAGILFDRPRLFRLINNLNNLEDNYRPELVEWCKRRLAEIMPSAVS